MLYGVFSDVHANLEALDVVLAFFRSSGVRGHICCGDLVGYGPDPEPVLARVRALDNLSLVCGNHDLAAIGRMDVDLFNPYARAAALWTRRVLSDRSRAFLEGLTARVETADFTIVHGSPRRPADEYLLSAAQFKENMPRVSAWPLFMGHSHMPLCLRLGEEDEGKPEAIFLEEGQEMRLARKPYGIVPAAFNPGSVGQPRDHDKRAACALYDSERGTYRIARLEYDIEAVQAKIHQAGLPEFLALRLAYGQ